MDNKLLRDTIADLSLVLRGLQSSSTNRVEVAQLINVIRRLEDVQRKQRIQQTRAKLRGDQGAQI